jgi:hypothetical protein
MKITKKKQKKNKDDIKQLLFRANYDGIEGLVYWLERDTDYFTAPASTRVDYHGCCEGGLAEHSLNVYRLFNEKAGRFGFDLQPEAIIVASLMHDLCKVNQYVPNRYKTGKNKGKLIPSKPYKVQDDFPLGHGEKSVYLLTRHIDLTDDEALLIRWHMGPFDAAWEKTQDKVVRACPAIYALHNADQEASKYLDGGRVKK